MQALPTNDTILRAIHGLREGLVAVDKEEPRLKRDGRKILETTNKLLEDAETFVSKKNGDNIVQQILQEAREAQRNLVEYNRPRLRALQRATKDAKTTEMRNQMRGVVVTIKNVLIELITSTGFRSSLTDLFNLLRTTAIKGTAFEEGGAGVRKAIEEGNLKDALRKQPLARDEIEQLASQFQRVLEEISRRPGSRDALKGILDMFDMIRGPTDRASYEGKMAFKDFYADPHVSRMMELSRELFENFAGRGSVDVFLSHARVLRRAMTEDENIRNYLHDLSLFSRYVLRNPDMIGDPSIKNDVENFITRARDLFQNREDLRGNMQAMLEEGRKILNNLQNDPLNLALKEDLNRLVSLLLLNKQGRPTFKPKVIQQLKVILVAVLAHQAMVPLPAIEYNDNKMGALISGMTLNLGDLIPDNIIAKHKGKTALNAKELQEPLFDSAKEQIKFVIKGINAHVVHANITFHRDAFPRIRDDGYLTVHVPRKGIDLMVTIEMNALDKTRILRPKKVKCKIHNLQIRLSDTKHDLMYNTALRLVKGRIKSKVNRSVHDGITNVLNTVNNKLAQQIDNIQARRRGE